MEFEHTIARYRTWYRKLLRLYSRPYRERFAEGMEQTFNDVCRERAKAGKGLLGFVLWVFVETLTGIIRENLAIHIMQKKIVRIAIVVGVILLIPFFGDLYVDGWNWDALDFVVAGALLFGTGLTFELVASKVGAFAYRAAVGVACLAGFLLVWINAAVGIIGDVDEANAMYLGVLVVGFIGAFIARFEPRGMSRAIIVTAAAQFLVPLIAMTWVPEERFSPGYVPVICLNAVFVAMWIVSAMLFRYAVDPLPRVRSEDLGGGGNRVI
jgi:hypothetical protein